MRLQRMGTTAVITLSILMFVATAAEAQVGRNGEPPPGWMARYDDGSSAEGRALEVMRPGWHVFAGSGATLWDPGHHAAGDYSVSSTMFLFPQWEGRSGSRSVDAPYGIILGGSGLDGDAARYVALLIRNDGSFAVIRHAGGTVAPLVDWTEHAAVVTLGDEGTAENVLAVDATAEAVTFWINEQQVAELPRDQLSLEGFVGLRTGADLSLHVTDLVIGANRR